MRIVYICESTIPSTTANSVQVMKMCQALVQQGHETTLLAPRNSIAAGPIDPEMLRHHYGLDADIDLRHIAGLFPRRRHDLYPKMAWQARRLEAELVLARSLGGAAWSAWSGIPTIYEAHDVPLNWQRWPYFRALLRAQHLRGIVVISDALKRMFQSRLGDRLAGQQLLVAHDGVDLDRFSLLPGVAEARQRLRLPLGKPTLGYAGHLYPGRGVELMLTLAERLPLVQFLLVGGTGDAVAQRRREVHARGLANVRFVGFVANAELPRYFAACDALLMPYQRKVAVGGGGGNTAGWMSPMKMFEYMASGRLLISSDLPVLREVLHAGNAALCDPEDVSAWQAAIERAISDPPWKEALARQALHEVKHFCWQSRARRIVALSRSNPPADQCSPRQRPAA